MKLSKKNKAYYLLFGSESILIVCAFALRNPGYLVAGIFWAIAWDFIVYPIVTKEAEK
jgi:hypothetical protein